MTDHLVKGSSGVVRKPAAAAAPAFRGARIYNISSLGPFSTGQPALFATTDYDQNAGTPYVGGGTTIEGITYAAGSYFEIPTGLDGYYNVKARCELEPSSPFLLRAWNINLYVLNDITTLLAAQNDLAFVIASPQVMAEPLMEMEAGEVLHLAAGDKLGVYVTAGFYDGTGAAVNWTFVSDGSGIVNSFSIALLGA
jgi:hypothetical protein